MGSNKINKLTAVAGLALFGFISNASAATVNCPGTLSATLTRQVEVTGALTGGTCYYQDGNFQGDDLSAGLGSSYTLIEKDIAPNGGTSGSLNYAGSTSGTWSITNDYWATYAELFIAFHFGNGSGSPDSFIVELDPGALNGTWALIPTNLANGLSNIYLAGRGTATGSGGSGGNNVPEPGTLTLLGLGLLGLGFSRRLVKSK